MLSSLNGFYKKYTRLPVTEMPAPGKANPSLFCGCTPSILLKAKCIRCLIVRIQGIFSFFNFKKTDLCLKRLGTTGWLVRIMNEMIFMCFIKIFAT